MSQTVVGVFDSRADAETAVNALQLQGFDRSAVQITSQTSGTSSSGTAATGDDPGVLESIGNFFGKLFGDDDNDRRVGQYAQAVQRGGCVVRVDVDTDAEAERAVRALEGAGAVDIDERVAQWGAQSGGSADTTSVSPGMYSSADGIASSAVSGTQTTSASTASSSAAAAQTLSASQTEAIPVVQESLEVGKRVVSQGAVRVYARTVEQPVTESVELREEHARVERRPVDRPATEADLAAFTDRTIEVTEMAEKAVVGKTARVVEEVVVGKEATQRTETISDTVRHTEVNVERVDTPATASDTAWRSDYQTRYASLGGSYDEYDPAYRYGSTLAGDARYSGRDWASIEADARSGWERDNAGGASTWDKVKDAVKHAWDSATGGPSSSSSSSSSPTSR